MTKAEAYENAVNKLINDGEKLGFELDTFFNKGIKLEIEERENEKDIEIER